MQNKLSREAKILIVSFVIYNIVLPLLTTFTNAFIWREKSDLISLLLFYIPAFIVTTFGFIFNGWLLRKINIKWLYAVSTISLVVGNCLLVFWGTIDTIALVVLGSIWGFTLGLYWANRNILTLVATNDENRNYFSGLENSIQIIIGMIVPLLVGYFIELTNKYEILSYDLCYKIIALIALFITFLGALFIIKANFTDYTPKKLWLGKASKNWSKMKLIILLYGLISGIIMVFPSFLVLTMIGKEGSLGFMDSAAALIGAIAIYLLGKKIRAGKRQRILHLSLVIEIVGMVCFYLLWGGLGAGIYVLMTNLRAKVFWVGLNPLIMKFIDNEANENDKYAYNVDREVYLNSGRLISLVGLALINNTTLVVLLTPILVVVCITIILLIEYYIRTKALTDPDF